MRIRAVKLLTLGVIIAGTVLFGLPKTKLTNPSLPASQVNAQNLRVSYNNWKQTKALNPNHNLELPLGWLKGISTESSLASGSATVNLAAGAISGKITDLAAGNWQLWLIENTPGPGYSTLPDPGDKMLNLGNFTSNGSSAQINLTIAPETLAQFRIDRAVVTRAGKTPLQSLILTGSPALFDRLEQKQAQAGALAQAATTPALLNALTPVTASADSTSLDDLVARGNELFDHETFGGNGRTCATCHPEDNNFTIDPKYIAGLAASDPLFVAEFNPALAQNFENPQLMRRFGLILENVDGFEDLTNKFVLRSVPHLLGLRNTITAPDPAFVVDFTTNGRNPNPAQRLGWSGDGAPGSGTLREFAIGAIIQHFPKTLQRANNVDFRLPTDDELDALEAYQLSLGRQEELDIRTLQVNDSLAGNGKALYLDTGTIGERGHKNCNACHFNAGATNGYGLNPFAPGFSPVLDGNPRGFNGTQGTATILLPQAFANGLPFDGGFGRIPFPFGGFGNFGDFPGLGTFPVMEFNSPSVIESADTAPYFHNNMVATLEEAVAFYGTPAFNDISSIGGPLGVVPVSISANPNDPEVQAISAFLRALNAVDNIRSTINFANQAVSTSNDQQVENLRLALHDNNDAIMVLSTGAYAQNRSAAVTTALQKLANARVHLENALRQSPTNGSSISSMVAQAVSEARAARAALVNVNTLPQSFRN